MIFTKSDVAQTPSLSALFGDSMNGLFALGILLCTFYVVVCGICQSYFNEVQMGKIVGRSRKLTYPSPDLTDHEFIGWLRVKIESERRDYCVLFFARPILPMLKGLTAVATLIVRLPLNLILGLCLIEDAFAHRYPKFYRGLIDNFVRWHGLDD